MEDALRAAASSRPFIVVRGRKVTLWMCGLLAGLCSAVMAIVLVETAEWVFKRLGGDTSLVPTRTWGHSAVEVAAIVLVAPVVESFLLAGGIGLLGRFTTRVGLITLASAIGWGALHALGAPFAFFGTACAFAVFSWSYQAWRVHSFRLGVLAAAIPHVIHNALTMALVIMGG
jgi:hypothetical protein